MVVDAKYPRTPHLPWSPGFSGDDERMASSIFFEGRRVIVTEKMDGENTTILSNCQYHARSLDSGRADWRSNVGFLASIVGPQLPPHYRLCGENLYAAHSIKYVDLESYFYAFNVWDRNFCLSWNESVEWFEMLDLTSVPVIYDGPFDKDLIHAAWEMYSENLLHDSEGYVVRRAEGFLLTSFGEYVAKYVRKDHVKTGERWEKDWVKNDLKKGCGEWPRIGAVS